MAFIGAGQSDTLWYDLNGICPEGPRHLCTNVTFGGSLAAATLPCEINFPAIFDLVDAETCQMTR